MAGDDPKRSLKIMRIYLVTVLILSSLAAAGERSVSEELDEFFTEQARLMNEGLPEMVDGISRLDRVEYSDLTFTHFYTPVGISDAEFQQEYPVEVLEDFFSSNACENPQSKNAMQDGLTFAYEFRSNNGEKLAAIAITYADCQD